VSFILSCSFIFLLIFGVKAFWNRPPWECSVPDLDMGLLSITGDIAENQKDVKIKNNTTKAITIQKIVISCPCLNVKIPNGRIIPPNGEIGVVIQMRLQRSDVSGKEQTIDFYGDDNELPPIKIIVRGRPNYGIIFSGKELRFPVIYRNDVLNNTETYYVCETSKERKMSAITEVKTCREDMLEVKLEHSVPLKNKNAAVEDFYILNSAIRVKLKVNKHTKLGIDNANISILLKNKKTKTIPVTWEVRERSVFEPETYYLINAKHVKFSDFTVMYNTKVGGRPKNVLIVGTNLKIISHEEQTNYLKVYLNYKTPLMILTNEVIGTLVIETEDGRKHELPIIAS
jgi:hypothetical protein